MIWLVAVLALLAWVGEGLFILITHDTTGFEQWRQGNEGFETLFKFVGPVLAASMAAALFLFWWYRWTKRRYLVKALRDPRRLVPTAGYDTAQIVGCEDIAQVIAERLRERDTRRPYLLVGGVGTGKTAVLVRLTEHPAAVHLHGPGAAAARTAHRHVHPAGTGHDLSARLQVPALPVPSPGRCAPGEIRESFCRQQQALLPGSVRRWLPRGLRRKTPHWVGMRVRELDRFWDAMAGRTRD
uniref:hypothetical protein n=1 Tax=Streptomyces asoensis TaxID=249586 RepID=UPI00209C6968|nr:hypothetical protein [Streptomyces asoensis]